MLGELNSFFEVTFAIYASLCIDERINTKLWAPNISPTFSQFLEKNPIWKDLGLNKTITDIINKKTDDKRYRFYNLGWMMIIFNIIILIYSGYEKSQEDFLTSYLFEILFSVIFVSGALMMFFKYKNWIKICFITTLFLLSFFIYVNRSYIPIIENGQIIFKSICLILISIPVLIAFLWKFLVKEKYIEYIEATLTSEISTLKKADSILKAKEESERNGNSESSSQKRQLLAKMPSEYKDAFSSLYISCDENRDNPINFLADAFKIHFSKECHDPDIYFLIKYFIKNKTAKEDLKRDGLEVPSSSISQ